MKNMLLAAGAFLLLFSGALQAQQTYTNPLRAADGQPLRVADPFVFRVDSLYYLTGTTRQGSGFDCYTS